MSTRQHNLTLLTALLLAPLAALHAGDASAQHSSPNIVFILAAPHSTIREGDWKLIFDWSGELKLYHIAANPFERDELSARQPEKILALFRKLNDWLDANVATKYPPALNPDYHPAKEVRARPFVDLRKKHLGDTRAIRRASSDPRFEILRQHKVSTAGAPKLKCK